MRHQTITILCGLLITAGLAHAATLDVDKQRSRIQVNAKATGHAFTGTLKDFKATVSGDAAALKPAGFDLSWNFKNLDTADAKRDAEMLKWLGGGAPNGSFKFTKTWTDKAGKDQCMGTLTIHGVSKTISFPYTAKKEGDWVTIDGSATMDYQNFSLPIIRAMAVMTVDPKLEVVFHVVGKVN
jgi:polyisoprenoid-binding protein YceI